jgi:serine phosphatase RsbU (regulator of sigma subunit)
VELLLGIAKINKFGSEGFGDCVDVTERPSGGLSAVLADGHGGGRSAMSVSAMVATKVAQLISDGMRDGAVARAIHDYLGAMHDGKLVSALTIISADLGAQSLLLSRNTNCPVIIRHEYGVDFYDEPVQSIGVHKSVKAMTAQRPLEEGLLAATFSDGVLTAGRKRGRVLDMQKITKLLEESRPEDVQFVANSILDQALGMDDFQAADHMTVIVLGVGASQLEYKIERRSASYPA